MLNILIGITIGLACALPFFFFGHYVGYQKGFDHACDIGEKTLKDFRDDVVQELENVANL